ncbi:hypothetical protein HDV57DRAFT_488125 [Trichoderma longibrachiatum]
MEPHVNCTVSKSYDEIRSILDAIIQFGLDNHNQSISSELTLALNNLPAERRQLIQLFARRLHDACQKFLQPGSSITQNGEPKRLRIIDKLRLSGSNPKTVKADVDAMLSTSNDLKGDIITRIDHDVRPLPVDNSERSDAADQATSTVDSTLTPINTMTTPSLMSDDMDDGGSGADDSGLNYIREQTIDEFISDARGQLHRIGTAKGSSRRSARLATLMNDREGHDDNLPNGSEWFFLAEKGYGDHQRDTIFYAMAAVGFENWHRLEVQKIMLLQPELKLRVAKMEVSGIVLGPKPVSSTERRDWDRRRKHLSTHLSRGRKWRQLVDTFGRGILFKSPWQLAKTKARHLDLYIEELKRDERKCLVLTLLDNQVNLLFQEGSINEPIFCKQLQENGFQGVDSGSAKECLELELNEFQTKLRQSRTDGKLLVTGTKHVFEANLLQRLGLNIWLHEDLILACMHLSRKLPFVRVGWSIAIHHSDNPDIVLEKPFESASRTICKLEMKEDQERHVYFFSLHQRNNHFSLLEIDMREGFIYHYDSFININAGEENEDVRNACMKTFSNLTYYEKGGIQQDDDHSCGPIVIKTASRRMWGETAISSVENEDSAESLRLDAVRLLYNAWETGKLVKADGSAKKRGRAIGVGGIRGTKRQKVDNVNL